MRRRGSSPIALLVLIAFALVIYVFRVQLNQKFARLNPLNTTSNEISNWNTYRNDEIGFEFRYPSSYRIEANEISASVGSHFSVLLWAGQDVALRFDGVSENYSGDGGATFGHTRGFIEKDGKYYCKFLTFEPELLISNAVVEKKVNSNGVELLIVKSLDTESRESGEYACDNPGKDNIGVLVNLKREKNQIYTGFGISYYVKGSTLPIDDFEKILDSLKVYE